MKQKETNKVVYIGMKSKSAPKKRLINICEIEELQYLMQCSAQFEKQN